MKNTSNFESFSIFYFYFLFFLQNGQNCFKIILLSFIWSLFLQRDKKKVNRETEVNKGDKLKEVGGGGKERKVR